MRPLTTATPCLFSPASRASDPATSKAAEKLITLSGQRSGMTAKALEFVKKYPGHTSAELEAFAECRDGQLRKRLNDLREAGEVKPGTPKQCTVTGMQAQTWYLAEPKAETQPTTEARAAS